MENCKANLGIENTEKNFDENIQNKICLLDKCLNNIKNLTENSQQTNSILQTIIDKYRKSINYNTDEYIFLGSMCYFLDPTSFVSSTDFSMKNISKCLNHIKDLFDYETLLLLKKIVCLDTTEPKPYKIFDLFSDAKNSVEESLDTIPEISKEKHLELMKVLKSVIINSAIPIQFVVELYEIDSKITKYLVKSENLLTYNDYLRLNLLLWNNLKFAPKATKDFTDLLSSKDLYNDYFYTILENGLSYNNDRKFSMLYLDNIISTIEMQEKDNYVFENIIAYMNNEYVEPTDSEIVENIERQEVEIETDPVNALLSAIKETIDKKDLVINEENLIKFFEDCAVKDEELTQSIYVIFVSKIKNLENKVDKFTENTEINYDNFLVLLQDKVKELSASLKENTEKFFVDLDTVCDLDELHNKMNLACSDILISDKEAKGYILSQMFDNFTMIRTFKQLNQFMGVFESQDISGNSMKLYVDLFNFVKNNQSFTEIISIQNTLQSQQFKLHFISGIYACLK